MHNGIDWVRVRPLAIPVFLERFSLHDSSLIGISLDSQRRLLVEVQFDLHWNCTVPAEHDTLLIRFERIYCLNWTEGSWQDTTLSDAVSTVLDSEARAALLENSEFDLRAYQGRNDFIPHPAYDETLTRTVFNVMNWGRLNILHGAEVRLAVTADGTTCVDVSEIAHSSPNSRSTPPGSEANG